MSIFGSILDRIFHHGQQSTSAPATQQQSAGAGGAQQAGGSAAGQQQASAGMASPSTGASTTAPTGGATGAGMPSQPVDVEAVLNAMAAKNPQKLNWRTSIVDLMKLLGLDSSFDARKTLASELHYNGDPNDSAAMNIWLHKAVMQKLAENGGKVPQDLVRH